jgi:hypothetical protein
VDSDAKDDLHAACVAGGALYAVGTHGTVVAQSDLRGAFLRETSGTDRDLHGVAAADGAGPFASTSVIAVGSAGTIVVKAADGGAWAVTPSGFTEDLFAVDGNAPVTVVGKRGRIAHAAPGDAGGALWVADTSRTTADVYAVASDAALHLAIAVGAGGAIVERRGDAPWTAATSGTTADLFAVGFAGGAAYAAGADGALLRRDGAGRWSAFANPTGASIHTFAPGLGSLFALAEGGVVLRLAGATWAKDPLEAPAGVRAIALRLDELWGFGANGVVVSRRLF